MDISSRNVIDTHATVRGLTLLEDFESADKINLFLAKQSVIYEAEESTILLLTQWKYAECAICDLLRP